ncbi:hypothetical protein FLL45_07425 [Aliikangiella marina]|uniref:Tetratricopeptide repeat protein n=1 Tax=Aliikangiella marina TaxID=1712262 RepID=A0A545TC35_9GAMM|nr:hypothetical protein [Aliikangiella marina]TQV74785.1 hypothetical protein FLL45_07425 [Aliikangiella marina]
MKLLIMNIAAALTVALSIMACGGPGIQRVNPISANELGEFADKPAPLRPYYVKLKRSGRHNAVLHSMELGVAAMYLNELDIAEQAFDQALSGIETIYTDDKFALEARSLWHKEGRKDFKGEPYERSMAYYYRGLLYLMRGDYGNARASFEGGIIQDAFAEEEQNRSDFASLMFLSAWSAQKMGSTNLAEQAYQEVERIRPDFVRPNPDDNLLLIAETGKGPRKLADGVGHWELVFRRGKKFNDKYASFTVNGKPIEAIPTEDVYYQATTRGGRPIDGIVKGKANFRKTSGNIATSTAQISESAVHYSALTGSGGAHNVAGAFAALSVVSLALSSNVESEADTRYWSSLPDVVSFATTKVDPSNVNIDVSFMDINKQPVQLPKVNPITVFDNKQVGIVWAPSRVRSKL